MEKEQYQKIIKSWAKASNDDDISLTFCDYILYALLRGKDPEKGVSKGTRDSTWGRLKIDWLWYKYHPERFLGFIGNAISEEEFQEFLADKKYEALQ